MYSIYTRVNPFTNNVLSQPIYQELKANFMNGLTYLLGPIGSMYLYLCRLSLYLFFSYSFLFGPITSQLYWQFYIFIVPIYLIFFNIILQPWKLLKLDLQSEVHGLQNGVSTSSTVQSKTRLPIISFCNSIKSSFKKWLKG